jgi:diaminopimelate epimerase
MRGLLDREVTVTTRGGDLGISWAGEGKPVMMTGPAVTVFEGEFDV